MPKKDSAGTINVLAFVGFFAVALFVCWAAIEVISMPFKWCEKVEETTLSIKQMNEIQRCELCNQRSEIIHLQRQVKAIEHKLAHQKKEIVYINSNLVK